jgi:membrane-bound lytic murein transglycosylase D
LRTVFFAICFALYPLNTKAETYDPAFNTPPGLQGAVDFWIQVFTTYGKYQSIIHHRDDPAIVYSIMDFTEFAQGYSPGVFIKRKEEELDREIERIQSVLHKLASGQPAETPFERRIERLFDRFPGGNKRARYLEAAKPEKIRSQTGIKERFREGLKRSGQYLQAIEDLFSERGLPSELARLPFVESSFDYDAYSSVGAAGIWQFMRSTAKPYMRVGAAIDERRDPIIATRAAAEYLSRAHKVLGNWPLALTSYNHGITGVLRAANSVGSRDIVRLVREYEGKGWGFASKNFYAEFLAALHVERNYKRYFPDLILDKPVYFDEVKLGGPIGYGALVSASGLRADDFEHLNPAIRRKYFNNHTPVPSGVLVKVPHGRANAVLNISRGAALVWQHTAQGSRRFQLHQFIGTEGESRPESKPRTLRSPAKTSARPVKKALKKPAPKKAPAVKKTSSAAKKKR